MKKQLFTACTSIVTCIFLFLALVSCSVDDRYDMSKDIDATIGVGKGLALPIGSTQKFFISDFIDTDEVELLSVDDVGNIVISTGDSFVSESFKIDETSFDFTIKEDIRSYDFKTRLLKDDLPDNMPLGTWPYVVYDTIDFSMELNITEDELPKEITRLTKLTFKEPVKLSLFVTIYGKTQSSKELFETTGLLNLEGDEGKAFFEIDLPDFLVFDKNTRFEDGILKLDGQSIYDKDKEAFCYERVFYVDSIDFTRTEKGYLEITDGVIDFNEVVSAHGIVKSDIVYFDLNNLTNIYDVEIKSELLVSELKLETVEGRFEPEIEPVSESIELDLGEDLDFLKNAYIDLSDPRLALTFDNGIDATILADASFAGYDEYGNLIPETQIDVNLEIQPSAVTNILIDRYGNEKPGWTNYPVPNLNELLKNIPDRIDVDFNVSLHPEKYSRVTLGQEMTVGGSYEVQVPLAFDALEIEYTHSIEDVLGTESDESDNAGDTSTDSYDTASDDYYYNDGEYAEGGAEQEDTDISDVIKEIRGASISFTVLNTIPLGLEPVISLYDKNGNLFNDITFVLEGEIKQGNEVLLDGVIGEPVESKIKVGFSTQNGTLDNLYRIDIKLIGKGKGAINVNEYIQLTDISLSIDDYIVLDLNDSIDFD